MTIKQEKPSYIPFRRKSVMWAEELVQKRCPRKHVPTTTSSTPELPPESFSPANFLAEVSRRESIENRTLYCRFDHSTGQFNSQTFQEKFQDVLYNERLTFRDKIVTHCTRSQCGSGFVLEFMNSFMATRALHLNQYPFLGQRGGTLNRLWLYRPPDYSGEMHLPQWQELLRPDLQKQRYLDSLRDNRSRTVVVESFGVTGPEATAIKDFFGTLLWNLSLTVRPGNPVMHVKCKGDGVYLLTFRTLEEATFAVDLGTVEFNDEILQVTKYIHQKDMTSSYMPPPNDKEKAYGNVRPDSIGSTLSKPVDLGTVKVPRKQTVDVLELQDTLERTRIELHNLKASLDQVNATQQDTLRQLEAAQQDKDRSVIELQVAKHDRKITLQLLEAAKQDKKVQSCVKLQARFDLANDDLQSTLHQLEAAKQDLLNEKKLTASLRGEVEKMKEQLAVVKLKPPPKKKRRVSMDVDDSRQEEPKPKLKPTLKLEDAGQEVPKPKLSMDFEDAGQEVPPQKLRLKIKVSRRAKRRIIADSDDEEEDTTDDPRPRRPKESCSQSGSIELSKVADSGSDCSSLEVKHKKRVPANVHDDEKNIPVEVQVEQRSPIKVEDYWEI